METSTKEKIQNDVYRGNRLTEEQCLDLYRCNDLHWIGRLALQIREKLHGRRAYFVQNFHLNYTNLCVNSCRFCAFSKKEGNPDSYQIDLKEFKSILTKNITPQTKEIHIVGGCHPSLPFNYYKEMLALVRNTYPHVIIKAFSAVEIAHFADKITRTSDEDVLKELKESGLDLLPGGGAEQFSNGLRSIICPEKIDGDRWLKIHKTAHGLGIKTNATMLYGHIESIDDRVFHMKQLREAQDETGGFMSFIPLPFHPLNTSMSGHEPTLAVDDIKNLAISRIYLNNFPHIKAYWISLGAKLSQVALHFGADDFDGTVVKEKIYHSAGAETPSELTPDEICALISEAGFEPLERDGKYRAISQNIPAHDANR